MDTWKKIIAIGFICAAQISIAQNKLHDNTLDINYTATYKDNFSLRWSSRLSEQQNWSLKGFTAGGAYSLTGKSNRFSLTYDMWRGTEINAPLSSRYGLSYNTQSKYSNFSFSILHIDVPNQPKGFQGRIDLNMKFGK